ncbi:cell adhesion protein [Lysinibacillus sphaericus]|uniref:Cell adhesion protein n=1 Tax=Lysinibacillus sphaericus TaxID=1421 RepID=A0A544U7M6_LYSSH|nr:Ig-like domain-containing protein [Lysinibacillus sp. SDF0037]TQR27201.1 cell adhesion protein [Lysinibacillus sp. SDF0037]
MVNLFKKSFIYLALILLVLVNFSTESAHAEEGYTENLIPIMTSDESEFGKASSSSDSWDNRNTPGWKAFDGVFNYSDGSTYSAWGTSEKSGWLAYEFKSPKAISKYVMHNKGNGAEGFPSTWTFEAWDGSNWIVLDSHSNVTVNDWKKNPEQSFTFENTNYYNKYRVNVTLTNSTRNAVNTAICELQMMEKLSIPSKPETISLDKNNLELLEGSSEKLTATVTPDNAKVIWSSSNESIATVDQDGNVTALREGEAIITAKLENTDIAANSTVIVKKLSTESSNAILSITLVNGITKEYDVTNKVLNDYLKWFDSAQGTSTFKFTKTISPYKKVTEYIVHDKIASFEVREY